VTRLRRQLLLVFLGAGFAISLRAQASPSLSVDIADPRPLAKALQLLEAHYGTPISYEDPNYFASEDKIDYAPGDPAHRSLDLRGGRLTLTVSTPLGNPQSAIQQLIDEHAGGGAAGRFRLMQVGTALVVVPVQTRNATGEWVDDVRPLDTPVRIAPQSMKAYDALRTLCNLISSRGSRRVTVGTVPTNLLMQNTIQVEASETAARYVLVSIIQQLPMPLSWWLLADARNQEHVLNLHIVKPVAQR
jgi:hypothetical protein